MKKIILLLAIMLTLPLGLKAQNIRITKFDRNYTSLIATTNPVKDNTGEQCAVIRFYMRGSGYMIEPNQGVLRDSVMPGEIRMWVPTSTKRITVRHQDYMPLMGYDIPTKLEPGVDYDAWIEIGDVTTKEKTAGAKGNQGKTSNTRFLIGAGYNVMSISGPSASVGVGFGNHQIELGGVYGLGKTDRLYFYDSSSNLRASFQYQVIRGQLRYGYQIDLGSLGLTPQIGFAMNAYKGMDGEKDTKDYQNAMSVSALGAVRLSLALDKNKTFNLQVTGEYDFGIYKSDIYQLISEHNDTFKSWTDGINLNIGIMISI